ncbi:conserved protein, unknown function [Hepatocystis sp. ex Piliocolobus tephrosceles]|nr:conserved protein, unknown function [Hepatocystis sp. ex Piliocolobus tephrosceles]
MDNTGTGNSSNHSSGIVTEINKGDNLEIVKNMHRNIEEFRRRFALIKENYLLKDMKTLLSNVEYVDYVSFLAYFICAFFYSYLKVSGDYVENHPIVEDLKKVHVLMKEVKSKGGNEVNKENNCLKINKGASKRIIESCVSYNNSLKKKKKTE